MAKMPISPSAEASVDSTESLASPNSADNQTADNAFELPVETEIYILPDGQIVIADLPAELQPLLEHLGPENAQPCATQSALGDSPNTPNH